MYKHYVTVWSVDEEVKRGNKNSIHNFIDTNGDKLTMASKLHRISNEKAKKIWELINVEEDCPANEPKTNTGHWVKEDDIITHCSECGQRIMTCQDWFEYCPKCRTRMTDKGGTR